jgi:hypothetical protein
MYYKLSFSSQLIKSEKKFPFFTDLTAEDLAPSCWGIMAAAAPSGELLPQHSLSPFPTRGQSFSQL